MRPFQHETAAPTRWSITIVRKPRIGLLHLVQQLIDSKYVGDWKSVFNELKRIARLKPDADADFDQLLLELSWERVFDFCERLHGHLAQDVWIYSRDMEGPEVTVPRSEVQQHIANELQRLFLEERLAFEFSDEVSLTGLSLIPYLSGRTDLPGRRASF